MRVRLSLVGVPVVVVRSPRGGRIPVDFLGVPSTVMGGRFRLEAPTQQPPKLFSYNLF